MLGKIFLRPFCENGPISLLPLLPVSFRNLPTQPSSSNHQGLTAVLNVYVLVTSAMPFTAFLHQTGLVKTHLEKHSYVIKVKWPPIIHNPSVSLAWPGSGTNRKASPIMTTAAAVM